MSLTCPSCGREMTPVELETQTRFQNGDFQTTYQCPGCADEFSGIEQLEQEA